VSALAVVRVGALRFAGGPDTQMARNLARDPRRTVTTRREGLDVVGEGVATTVR